MKLVHAYTETGVAGYPGYINLSVAPDGVMVVTVRGPGNDGMDVASIHLNRENQDKLLDDLIEHYGIEEFKSEFPDDYEV